MAYPFNDHWITETLRLRESLWGPLDDTAETGRARAGGGDFSVRVVARARLLAVREGLDTTLARWRQIARFALLILIAGAILTGAGTAAAALGGGDRPVNLAVAVAALLGLNTLTLAMWAASFGVRADARGSVLANAWLALTRRIARGPDSALVPRALMELLGRERLTRWGAGVLSHGLWSVGLVSAVASLIALLATRRYAFQWETTLLSPDAFVAMVHAMGLLPSLLGFPLPPDDIVRASGGQQALPNTAHALWSAWLLGVVVVYGLLPRLLALSLSLIVVRQRLSRLSVDTGLPGIAELHDRLMPVSENTGIDAPAPAAASVASYAHAEPAEIALRCVVGIELPADIGWPPPGMATGIVDLGVIDTREQRQQVLETLRRHPAQRLLACCDARQTPDRGTVALLLEIASLSALTHVAFLPDSDTPARRDQWRHQVTQAGFPAESLSPDMGTGLDWLAAAVRTAPSWSQPR